MARLHKARDRIVDLMPHTTPEDYYVMPLRYSGGKRKRYQDATDEVLYFGFEKMDASVKMFVKSEKIEPDPEKPNPDPRAIQFRNAKYCVEVSRYLKPIEEHLYNLSGASAGVPVTRNIAKGLNQTERAELLRLKMSHFRRCVVLSLDARRFDQHVAYKLLQLEHSVYTRLCADAWFVFLLTLQLVNKCTTSKGIKYKTKGKRMSGDMNTALGNCLIMIIMIMAFLGWCSMWDCLDDGDDILLLIEHDDLARVLRTVKADFLDYGMEVKVENVTEVLEKVVFCQSQTLEYQPGKFKFTRNPWKVMSCALVGVKYYNQDGARAKLLHTIGLCELILNLGVPVLQSFALAVLRNCGTDEILELPLDGSLMSRTRRELRSLGLKQLERVAPQPIHDVARLSFHLAFDVDANRQIQMETWLDTWTFELSGVIQLPEEWNVAVWDHVPSCCPELYYP